MLFYKCLKDKAMNIEINQYSYLSPKNNNKQKEAILDANTRMVSLFLDICVTNFNHKTHECAYKSLCLYNLYNHPSFLHYSFSYVIKLNYKKEGDYLCGIDNKLKNKPNKP